MHRIFIILALLLTASSSLDVAGILVTNVIPASVTQRTAEIVLLSPLQALPKR